MRTTRPTFVLTLATSLVVAGAASAANSHAKPKATHRVCNLIVDRGDDAKPSYTLGAPGNPAPQDDGLDIESADIASNATTLTVDLRVKNLGASTPSATFGRVFDLAFDLPGDTAPVFLGYQVDASGGYADYGNVEYFPSRGTLGVVYSYVGKGAATAVVDGNQVRISVPVSALSALGNAHPGAKITDLDAQSSASYGEPDVLGNPYLPSPAAFVVPVGQQFLADDDPSSHVYIAGTPSCVTPGK